jgi:HK97 family phage major capsid protein
MNKKEQELRRSLTDKLKEARELIDAGKIEEGQKVTEEAESIRSKIELEEKMSSLENVITDESKVEELEVKKNEPKKIESRAVITKFLRGKKLTEEERKVLVETTTPGEDQNSVAVIVPEDISTEIEELKRQYKPLKQYVDVQTTGTNAGSFVYENGDSITPLLDLTEATEIGELTSPTLKNKSFVIKDKGGILPISNTLLSDEKGGLLKYINKWFARKQVVTENADILKTLKTYGVKLSAKMPEEVKTAINTLLDPELILGSVIITNQSGFNIMDNWVDATGKPLMQPVLGSATDKALFGYPVVEYSDTNITNNADGSSPVYIGNLNEAVKFMDREQFTIASSTEAGFTKNVTLIRLTERYDVVPKDEKAYLNISLSAPTTQRVVNVKEVTSTEPTTPVVTNYSVSFNADGGTPTPDAQIVASGSVATAPTTAPTKEGATFKHWAVTGTTTEYNFSTPVTANLTLVAIYE